MRIKVKQALAAEQPLTDVTVSGWVRTRRDAKDFSFVELNDGSCFKNLQVVVDAGALGGEHLKDALTGSSVSVDGELVPSPAKGQKWELKASAFRLLGRADAVLLHEHRLRLNPRCVWLDSAVLESRLNTCTAQGNAEWSETLALWRGVPLVDEPDAPWLVDWRERQRMRLAAALQAAAGQAGHRARCLQAVAADPGLRQHL